ncbi:MAG: 3-deoxy-8-phosphooctulonate synthase [Candidatus Sumerlaeota bacterium]|nr:3-deoxy-8-phosphooctulonate synthase [Candidatus Sumerlaeota bacterium]
MSGVFKKVPVHGVTFGDDSTFTLIAGLCVIENRDHTLMIARQLKTTASELGLPFCFKASFDKANRSSIHSYRGPGMKEGLSILREVKKELDVPILTDIHCCEQAKDCAEVADILQIPAFLCRQTDLLLAAARSGRAVNVKKGQFMAPWDMKNIIEKLESAGCEQIILTERGVTFGYNNLVSDMRSLVIMRSLGYPVIFDATHSVQLPGELGKTTGGQREFIEPLTRAALAVGVDGIYLEVHEAPERALSDGQNSIPLEHLKGLLSRLQRLDRCVRSIKD